MKKEMQPSFAREMAKTARGREHEESNINVAKNGKLISLFDKSISAFGECDLSVGDVFNFLNQKLVTAHVWPFFFCVSENMKQGKKDESMLECSFYFEI